ncbi:MAG: S8 family serine peptidase [Rhodothalassiaceae bacterium]
MATIVEDPRVRTKRLFIRLPSEAMRSEFAQTFRADSEHSAAYAPQFLGDEDHPYLGTVRAAVDAGIPVIFAAGNNHFDVKCMHDPSACSPNTIWGANSDDAVLSVGTVNRAESNRDASTPHANSSRGPGQWARNHLKPDCVAPTYGETVWGNGYRAMDWWGTSGAAPQAAGLAALLLSLKPSLTPQQVYDIIRESSRRLEGHGNCVGHGLIDCDAAVKLL